MTKFKVGDRVLVKQLSLFFDSHEATIVSIEKCKKTNRWLYELKPLKLSLLADTFGIYTDNFFKSEFELDQQYMNERKMKELLGVK